MVSQFKRRLADIAPGSENPLNYAVTQRDKSTLEMVKDAIEYKQTLLAYQPVMRASDHSKVAFFEGLIRVMDATGRVIPARDFMPVIENTETGRQIDVLALRAGLLALQNNPGLRLSINMSARSIGYKSWNQMIRRFLNRDKTIGERLILEITESSAMTVPELVTDLMDELQPFGVCFALDDFGAGHTAIRYFKDFYFDILKIDGEFIKGIADNADNRALTAAMISIADHFDMLTVAEFVENAQDAAVLTEMGVDCLQGYYFSAPTTRPSWLRNPAIRSSG
ncbi:EAL domain-containing protein [Sulfitobacter sp. SK011]|uniref:EAL domain-containing protein n=1 Tax=Sulfitobacter sp. SK011 TaxID=1389004 RepID=UPI00196424AF|nr:EAL domain-containing protein [Sulfitobacter sp. SK011]